MRFIVNFIFFSVASSRRENDCNGNGVYLGPHVPPCRNSLTLTADDEHEPSIQKTLTGSFVVLDSTPTLMTDNQQEKAQIVNPNEKVQSSVVVGNAAPKEKGPSADSTGTVVVGKATSAPISPKFQDSEDDKAAKLDEIQVPAPSKAKEQKKDKEEKGETNGNGKGKEEKIEGSKETVLFIKVQYLVYILSAAMFFTVVGITLYVLGKAFFDELEVNPQDPEKANEESNRWRIVQVMALMCLHMKVCSSILVAGQLPLSERLGMNLFDYNTLLGIRCIPGLLATLIGPALQKRFGSSLSFVVLGQLFAVGALLQTIAIYLGSYKTELAAVLFIEGTSGAAVAITAAVAARLVQGEEQSRAVSIISIYTLLGMATPLVIVPWLLEIAGLSFVCGIGTLIGGACGSVTGFAFFHITRGGLSIDEDAVEAENESGEWLFSPSIWSQGQGICIIVVMALINGVAITLGENITDLLKDNFGLKQTEVALTTFIGLVSCVVAQVVGVFLDSKGYRPVATAAAAVCLIMTIVLAVSHTSPIIAIVLWGIGYSFNLNTGFSSLPLVVPQAKITFIMALATAGQYVGFITIPIIYGYCAQYYAKYKLGFFVLIMVLALAIWILALLSRYNLRNHGGSLFGTHKYGEGDNIGDGSPPPPQDDVQDDVPLEQGNNGASSSSQGPPQ